MLYIRTRRNNKLTWVCLLQVLFQQAAVQEELEPRRLQRRAGPAAGHSSDPVCCLCTHPPLIDDDNISKTRSASTDELELESTGEATSAHFLEEKVAISKN